MDFHKRVHKETSNRGYQTASTKDPQIFYKPPAPGQQFHEAPMRNQAQGPAALRRRSPGKDQYVPNGVDSDMMVAPAGGQTDPHFSMRNTQQQWPSSIENGLNISNNRSTGHNFYQGPQQRQ